MKRQIPILLWTVLLLVFSGCSEKNYTLGGLGLPSFTQKVLDKTIEDTLDSEEVDYSDQTNFNLNFNLCDRMCSVYVARTSCF